ncbi:hypothetical protein [Paracraurococcus ruber]|uniref:Uncharacterized protein n=1 Tax=Paracraurococcus ruber TaxID=77675 RepID=A0ABS1D012_9PROT|nr:hypothetical protein [Paracraurococcus ruber]MBK1660128.1 hypothetical protein [Paracraurococcus ruber]TDG28017.1 hypothetical protein E2C05_21545 [Paracraurococcus ruber]
MPDDPSLFTAAERDLIRREFSQHFGQDPALAEGMFLRCWRTGPLAGQPKIPKAMEGLIARGLVEVSSAPPSILGTRAFFTPAGLTALRALLQDRRAMDPKRFGHLRRELGLDPPCLDTPG